MVRESKLGDAEAALLAHRRQQRGVHTFGDEADRALLAALAGLPGDATAAAREAGMRLGAGVYGRRYVETGLEGALDVLSTALHATGAGALRVESSFHRRADVRYEPGAALAAAPLAVRAAFVEGLLEGFLSDAFNCEAHARAAAGDRLAVELGAARDVNDARRRP